MTLGLKPLWKCSLWNKYLGKQSLKYAFLFYTKLLVGISWYIEWEFDNAVKEWLFAKADGHWKACLRRMRAFKLQMGNLQKLEKQNRVPWDLMDQVLLWDNRVGIFWKEEFNAIIHCKILTEILIFSHYSGRKTLTSSHLVILRQLGTLVPIWHCGRHSAFFWSLSYYHSWSLLDKMRKNLHLWCLFTLTVRKL